MWDDEGMQMPASFRVTDDEAGDVRRKIRSEERVTGMRCVCVSEKAVILMVIKEMMESLALRSTREVMESRILDPGSRDWKDSGKRACEEPHTHTHKNDRRE